MATHKEVERVVQQVQNLLSLDEAPLNRLLGALIVLATLVTGRSRPRVLDARVGRPPPNGAEKRLTLDPTAEQIFMSVIEPEGVFKPSVDQQAVYSQTAVQFSLPMPTQLRELLVRICPTGTARVLDLAVGVDIDEGIKELTEKAGTTLARLRRWLSCRVQESSHDLCAAMVICGDMFGRTSAPLYYYSPHPEELRRSYLNAIGAFLPLSDASSQGARTDHGRLGPATLVDSHRISDGISNLNQRLTCSLTLARENRAHAIVLHNKLTDYLALHIALISSHRRNLHLYELTLLQFDLMGNLGVVSDKPVDAAHLNRAVALTPKLAEAIKLYRAHCIALAALPWASELLKKRVGLLLEGRAPLFFYLQSDGAPRNGSLSDWDNSLPESWGLFGPRSWHRPNLCMALRGAGASPIAVHFHLGHLDLSGFPASDTGLVAPTRLLDEVRPTLQQVEALWGIQVHRGLAEENKQQTLNHFIKMLWEREQAEHESLVRRANRCTLRVVGESRVDSKRAAMEWLSSVIQQEFAELKGLLLEAPSQKPGDIILSVRVADQAVQKLLVRIKQDHSHDSMQCLRIYRLLSSLVRQAIDRGYRYSPLARPSFPRVAKKTTLTRNSAAAYELILKIRAWWAGAITDPDMRRDHPLALRILALILDNSLISVDHILSIAKGDVAAQRLSKKDSNLYFDLDGGRVEVVSSATALILNLIPAQREEISAHDGLRGALPADLCPECDDLPRTLRALVDVASVLELPGFLRHAISGGSTSANLQDLATNRQNLPSRLESASDIKGEELDFSKTISEADPRKKPRLEISARQRWVSRRLRAAMSKLSPGARSRAIRLEDLANNLRGLQKTLGFEAGPPQTIEAALIGFSLSMAVSGTRLKSKPAVSTIATYVGTIAQELLAVFSGVALAELDADELLDGYDMVIQSKADHISLTRAISTLEDFHRYLSRCFDLPPVCISVSGNGFEVEYSASPLLSARDYDQAQNWLSSRLMAADLIEIDHCLARRQLLAAQVVLILLRRTGARIGEISWLQLSDFDLSGSSSYLRIRPSLYRRLKSNAGTRILALSDLLLPMELEIVRAYILAEKLRLSDKGYPLALGAFDDHRSGVGPHGFRILIQKVFELGAGIKMHPHLLRHQWSTERARMLLQTELDRDVNDCAYKSARRYRQLSAQLGHARITTTSCFYVHDLTAHRELAAVPLTSIIGRRCIINMLPQVSAVATDKQRVRIAQRAGRNDPIWISCQLLRSLASRLLRVLPINLTPITLSTGSGDIGLPSSVGLAPFDDLIRRSRSKEGLTHWAPAYGLERGVTEQLVFGIDELAGAPTYFRFFQGPSRRRSDIKTPIARVFDAPLHQVMLARFSKDRHLIRSLFTSVYRPSTAHHDRFLCASAQVFADLVLILEKVAVKIDAQGYLSLALSHPSGLQRGLFHQVSWVLALCAVSSLTSSRLNLAGDAGVSASPRLIHRRGLLTDS
ncbi:site-specific integrase [Polycyclovorans algicola]|uniref:site-specific integrase n=1 Tax=Polycyclovorans algicola TaxID=616992 RepID=UPI0012684F9B|nr:site-specific integrase [Polycyclovorans algicola]